MDLAALVLSASLTRAQLRDIAEHPSHYSIADVHEATDRLRAPPEPLPEHPSDRFIAEHASRYSIGEVHSAIERLRRP